MSQIFETVHYEYFFECFTWSIFTVIRDSQSFLDFNLPHHKNNDKMLTKKMVNFYLQFLKWCIFLKNLHLFI